VISADVTRAGAIFFLLFSLFFLFFRFPSSFFPLEYLAKEMNGSKGWLVDQRASFLPFLFPPYDSSSFFTAVRFRDDPLRLPPLPFSSFSPLPPRRDKKRMKGTACPTSFVHSFLLLSPLSPPEDFFFFFLSFFSPRPAANAAAGSESTIFRYACYRLLFFFLPSRDLVRR